MARAKSIHIVNIISAALQCYIDLENRYKCNFYNKYIVFYSKSHGKSEVKVHLDSIDFVDLQSVFFFILIVLDNTAHLSQGLDTVDHLGVEC